MKNKAYNLQPLVTLWVYLKSAKKPFIFEYENAEKIDLKQQLLTKDIIQIGPIIFRRDDFLYAEIK